MAIKIGETYYGGVLYEPGKPANYGPPLPDVRDDDRFPDMDCKYCYTDSAPTVSSYEHFPPGPPTVQALCANCGAGLTPTEEYDEVTVG
jgi:hypothetical protein